MPVAEDENNTLRRIVGLLWGPSCGEGQTMKNYLAGIGGGAAMLLSIAATPVPAQMPDGGWPRTPINDVYGCNGALANMNGQLVCGKRHGSADGDRRDDHNLDRYGSSYDPQVDRAPRDHGWTGIYEYYGR
jgi:hypothetical protein